jgi:hypothetical protein
MSRRPGEGGCLGSHLPGRGGGRLKAPDPRLGPRPGEPVRRGTEPGSSAQSPCPCGPPAGVGVEPLPEPTSVHADCLSGVFRRPKRVVDVSEAFRRLPACYPRRRLFVIMDNLRNVHGHPRFLALLRQLRIERVWTPNEASWLDEHRRPQASRPPPAHLPVSAVPPSDPGLRHASAHPYPVY